MTDAIIIDGKAFSETLVTRIAEKASALSAKIGRAPALAVVLVGNDPASGVYVRNKIERTTAAGMTSIEHRLDAETGQDTLLALIDDLNNDDSVDGILVQLPLPDQIDESAVINAITPDKDVDGFHVVNAGRLATGQEALVPCTPLWLPFVATRSARISVRTERRGCGTLQHRWQTDGTAAASGKLYGYHRPFAHPRPAGRLRGGRYCGCRCWTPRNDHWRFHQARCHSDRCWDQPRTGP